MIFTECTNPQCNEPMTVAYEAGGPGAGGFAPVKCEKCGATSVVQLTAFAGETYSEADFKRLFIDTGKVQITNLNKKKRKRHASKAHKRFEAE